MKAEQYDSRFGPAGSLKLWPYQARDVIAIRSAFWSHSWVLYSLSTGAGKTVMFCHLLREWMFADLRVCVVVNSRHLVDQTSAALGDVPHGIIRGGVKPEPEYSVQVATVQALAARPAENRFDVYIVDEAHHAAAASYQKVLSGAKHVLGLTATPFRKDGIGIGSAGFTTLIQGPGIAELTPEYLSEAELYGPSNDTPKVDLKGIKKDNGDFVAGEELAGRVNQKTITGSAVDHYIKRANGSRALVYCVTRKHARDVARAFGRAGIATAYLDGTMGDTQRRDVLNALRDGRMKVVVSCELIGEGLDVPSVGCVILLRPTQSLRVLMQQVGRGLRKTALPGSKIVVLDHVGNFERNGWYPMDALSYSLEGKARNMREGERRGVRQCSACGRIAGDGRSGCEACGRAMLEPVEVNGELVRLGPVNLVWWSGNYRTSKVINGKSIIVTLGRDRVKAQAGIDAANARWEAEGGWPDTEEDFRKWLEVGPKREMNPLRLSVPKTRKCSTHKNICGKDLTIYLGSDPIKAQARVDAANARWEAAGRVWPDTEEEIREWLGVGPKTGKAPLNLSITARGWCNSSKNIGGKNINVLIGSDPIKAQAAIDAANARWEAAGRVWPTTENEFRSWLGVGPKRKSFKDTSKSGKD